MSFGKFSFLLNACKILITSVYYYFQDLGAHEDCVHTMAGGLWNDYYCGARYNYICGPGKLRLEIWYSHEKIR